MRFPDRVGRGFGLFVLTFSLLVNAAMHATGQVASSSQIPATRAAQAEQSKTIRLDFAQKSFPDAIVGVPYHSSVQAIGGWGLLGLTVSGDLPPGLYFETGANTVALGGMPASPGEYQVQITAEDFYGNAVKRDFTIHVLPLTPGARPQFERFISDTETFTLTDAGDVSLGVVVSEAENFKFTDAATVQIVTPTAAALTTPTPGSTLPGSSVTFDWTAGNGVMQYTIHVGTTGVGSSNISAPGSLTTTSYTVSGIPTTGGTLYVRLYSLIGGTWQYTDYTYAEANFDTKAAMSTPTPGSTLSGSSVKFAWTAGTGVTQYTIHVGTTGAGSSNISAPGSLTTTSYTVTGIPTTGGTLYLRLYSLIAGAWQYTDYTYTEASPDTKAVMSTPAPGSTLSGSSISFVWTAGTGVTQYTIHVGTTGVGSSNISAPGSLTTTSYTVGGIPTTGGTLYVRLYSLIAGAWQYVDYTYTEASPAAPATMTSPTAGSTLTGSTATFSWTAGSHVEQYDLHVGTTGLGSNNIFAGAITAQSQSVTGIPTTGGTLYVRLYSLIAGAWQYNDYTYTEQ